MNSRLMGVGQSSRSRLGSADSRSRLQLGSDTTDTAAQREAEWQAWQEQKRWESAAAAWNAMADWATTTNALMQEMNGVYSSDAGGKKTKEEVAADRAKLAQQMQALPGLQQELEQYQDYYDADNWSQMMDNGDIVTNNERMMVGGMGATDADWQGYQQLQGRVKSQHSGEDVTIYNPYQFYSAKTNGTEGLADMEYADYLKETGVYVLDVDALEAELQVSQNELANMLKNTPLFLFPHIYNPENNTLLLLPSEYGTTPMPAQENILDPFVTNGNIAPSGEFAKILEEQSTAISEKQLEVQTLKDQIQYIKDSRDEMYQEQLDEVNGSIARIQSQLSQLTLKRSNYCFQQTGKMLSPREQMEIETPYDEEQQTLSQQYRDLLDEREQLQAQKEWNLMTPEEQQEMKEIQAVFQPYWDLMDNEDFESRMGYEGETITANDVLDILADDDVESVYKYLNSQGEKGSREVRLVYQQQLVARVVSGGYGRNKDQYTYFTEEEIQTFNYIYNTQGKKAAEAYLNDYEDVLAVRQGTAIGKNISESDVTEALFSMGYGLYDFVDGIGSWFSDTKKVDPMNVANAYVRENLDTEWGTALYDLGNALGNMAPTLALSYVNPVAGAASVFASSGGNAYQSALNDGYSRAKAYTYGVLDGAFEAGTYYLLGKVGKGAGKLTEMASKPLYDAVKKASQKMAVKFTFSTLGNGLEEYLQVIMQPVIRNVALGEDNEFRLFSQEALYNGALGMLTAGLTSGAELAIGRVSNPFFGVFGTEGQVSKQVDADGNVLGYLHFAADGKTIDGYVQMAQAGVEGMHKALTGYGDIAAYAYIDASGMTQYGYVDPRTGALRTGSFDPNTQSNSVVATNSPMGMDASLQLYDAALSAVDNQYRTAALDQELAAYNQQVALQQNRAEAERLASKYPADVAQAFMDGYDGSLMPQVYKLGFHEVYTLAQQGYGLDEIMSHPEYTYSHMLTPSEAENAYNVGFAETKGLQNHENDGTIKNVTKRARKLKNLLKPYANSRPSYGKNQIEQVWEKAKDPVTGKVIDPSGVEIVWDRTKPRNGQWDMGHLPDHKYSEYHKKYMSGEMSKKEFLEWYRNPDHYRPELPSTNRSHKFE